MALAMHLDRHILSLTDLEVTRSPFRRRLNVLFLADDRHAAGVVQDHIEAFTRHSRHRFVVLNPIHNRDAEPVNFNWFDVVVIHYSICILFDYFLPEAVAEKVKAYRGPKVQLIQDEHRWIDRMTSRMAELGVCAVLSSLEPGNIRRVYHDESLRDVTFYSTLPGYMPERLLSLRPSPIRERHLHAAYRGRVLPFWMGSVTQEKAKIGLLFLEIADRFDLAVDIKINEEDRIYGDDWLTFLCSAKAMLATEGGASIFDFAGEAEKAVLAYLEDHPNADFASVDREVLGPYEGNIVHRTITPRAFETIAAKTVLVMYPGAYRGILDPWEHYIPLEPDGSNAAEVAGLLRDDTYLQAVADRAHNRVMADRSLFMDSYVGRVDAVIARAYSRHPNFVRRELARWARAPLRGRHFAIAHDLQGYINAVEEKKRKKELAREEKRERRRKKIVRFKEFIKYDLRKIASSFSRFRYSARDLLTTALGRRRHDRS